MAQRSFEEQRTPARARWLRSSDWPFMVKGLIGIVSIVALTLGVNAYVNARTLQAALRDKVGVQFETLASAQAIHLVDLLSEQLAILRSVALTEEIKVGVMSANARYSGDQAAIEAQLLAIDERWREAADDSELVQSIIDPRYPQGAFPRTAQLLDYKEAFPDHVEILVTDRYGGLLAATDRTSDYYQADEGWWQAAYNDGEGALYVAQPEYDVSAGYVALDLAAPIRSERGQVIGIARTTFRMDAVYQAVSELQFGETGHVTVIDSAGLVVADPNPEQVGQDAPRSWYTPEMQRSASGWRESVDEGGVPAVVGHAAIAGVESAREDEAAAIQSLGWVLYVTQSQAEAYAAVTSATWMGILVAAAFALVAAGLAFAVARTMVAPIRDLARVARQVAAGDLSIRARVRRRDETGELAEAFNGMADEIMEMVATLEQRVARRTRGLQAVAEVSRATTLVLDPDALLRQVVDLVRGRFGLYYVGLFLLDEGQQYAVLRAGTGEAGRRMLTRGHRLQVGGASMIGQCVSRGEARVALDVGEEAVRFDNPLLPDTRSELALPLRARGRVIGAMTVQSAEEAVFDEGYVITLQTMADQVAVAIDNAQLFADSQAALRTLETAQRRYLGQAWTEYARGRAVSGYERVGGRISPLGSKVLPQVRHAVAVRRPVVSDSAEGTTEGAPSTLVTPIVFGDRVVGALGLKEEEDGRRWGEDEVALAQAIGDQFAQAAENLRLLEKTQRDEARERLTREITDDIRAAVSVDDAIQRTLRQLGHVLGASEMVARIGTEGELLPGLGEESDSRALRKGNDDA